MSPHFLTCKNNNMISTSEPGLNSNASQEMKITLYSPVATVRCAMLAKAGPSITPAIPLIIGANGPEKQPVKYS